MCHVLTSGQGWVALKWTASVSLSMFQPDKSGQGQAVPPHQPPGLGCLKP